MKKCLAMGFQLILLKNSIRQTMVRYYYDATDVIRVGSSECLMFYVYVNSKIGWVVVFIF